MARIVHDTTTAYTCRGTVVHTIADKLLVNNVGCPTSTANGIRGGNSGENLVFKVAAIRAMMHWGRRMLCNICAQRFV